MSTSTSTTTSPLPTRYAPGDIVNGHRLSADGTAWEPLYRPTRPAAAPPVPVPTGQVPALPRRNGRKALKLLAIGGAGLLAVGIVVSAASGGSDASDDANVTAAAPAAPAEEAAAPAVAGIGTPVRDGEFEFVVTGLEWPGNVIGSGFLKETAQGEFVIVRIDVTNIGDEAQTLSDWPQRLFNDRGQEFEPSRALFALEDADKFFLETINPGNSVTGAPLLFDVPVGTVLDRVELHDSLFSGGFEISLR